MKRFVSAPKIIVVGAGIVGLAAALNIQRSRPNAKLVVVDKESTLARHQSGNNSGVIHSGLYYKPGSLKARNCYDGYQQLVAFCSNENVPYEICGKVVVATSESELPRLAELHRRGVANGLENLRFLESPEIREIEPYCRGLRGLFVPQAGIVDYKSVAKKYAEKLVEMGAEIILGEYVDNIRRRNDGLVEVIGSSQTWVGNAVVVCAGLHSDRLALQVMPDLPLRILPFRGEYYKLKPSAQYLVKNLIYPVPDPAFPFLGVHFTRMAGGGVECGPNAVFAFGREAYRKTDFNFRDTMGALAWPGFLKVVGKYWRTGLEEYYRSMSKQAFVNALQKLIPDIQADHLDAGGAGVRAQACDRQGKLLDDFDIRSEGNVVYVCNAPSPAATASLAIGSTISTYLLSQLD
jgi:L-2-hydroxyglutarate oxidase